MAKTTISANGNVTLRKQKNRTGTYSLFFDIHTEGTRYKEYLGASHLLTGNRASDAETLKSAKAILDKRREQIRNAAHGVKTVKAGKVDFVAYVASFIPDKSKAWLNAYKHLVKYTKGKTVPMSHIDQKWIDGWKAYLTKHLKPTSARTYNAVIITALNTAVRRELLPANPYNLQEKRGISAAQPQREYLTLSEVQTLQETPCSQDTVKRAFLFSCYCGLRLSDVKRLTWGDIRPEGVKIAQQKTDEVNYLPLSDASRRFLGERSDDSSLVFALSSNDEHTRKHLKRWVAAAGIKKNISFHNARHSFATNLIDKGAEIYVVSKLLGHTDLKHTQVYAHMSTSKKAEAVNLLD